MKKQIKVLAVLSTAMFMAAVTPNFIGTASTAYAKNRGLDRGKRKLVLL